MIYAETILFMFNNQFARGEQLFLIRTRIIIIVKFEKKVSLNCHNDLA